jgi:hypothetical protein
MVMLPGAPVDVYQRDFPNDDGDPHTGAISLSPDIIVKPSQVTNPQAAFGETSGPARDSMTLSDAVEAGQDNYVYARLLNRGPRDASDVKPAPLTIFRPASKDLYS